MSATKEHYHEEICKGQTEADRTERPILFSTLMIRAILAGRKFQTRRIVKSQSRKAASFKIAVMADGTKRPFDIDEEEGMLDYIKCPYGKAGDILLVKEMYYAYGMWLRNGKTFKGVQKWMFFDTTQTGMEYHYQENPPENILPNTRREEYGWFKRSSLFMPYKVCRIKLLNKNIRVERLQNITEQDAIAEGTGYGFRMNAGWPDYQHIKNGVCELTQDTAQMSYASLWESINGKDSWLKNPWVWVIEFEMILPK